MIRCVIMRSFSPMWQDRHSCARLIGFSVAYIPLPRLSAWATLRSECALSQSSEPPWQASQPTPSDIWKRSPRRAVGWLSAWQSRHTFACVGSPRPSFCAIALDSGFSRIWYALACGSNSCQIANSFCMTSESRNGCEAPWQTLLLQVATPMCLCASIASSAVSAPAAETHRVSIASHCILIAALPIFEWSEQVHPGLVSPRDILSRTTSGLLAGSYRSQARTVMLGLFTPICVSWREQALGRIIRGATNTGHDSPRQGGPAAPH